MGIKGGGEEKSELDAEKTGKGKMKGVKMMQGRRSVAGVKSLQTTGKGWEQG